MLKSVFSDNESKPKSDLITTRSGRPIGDKYNVITAGPRGPLLMQDFQFLEEMAHFNRERIPERVVHAKGAGAFGYFEVTKDEIKKYCKAKVFESVGKRTPIAVRFSTVSGESGSADTVRDIRGFAIKFYTEEGIWDLVGNNSPIFFIRDPLLFPSLIHSQKRNPGTHLRDMDMFWDFISLRPETTHQMTFLFGDRGIPYGYRHMNGYGCHTFMLCDKSGENVFCKFHSKTDQGIKTMTNDEAINLAGSDPDYGIKDLYNSIEQGNFPSWTFYIQVMTVEEAKKWNHNPFDLTKVWPHSEFPLIEVGKIVLNRNPSNYFAEVEQIAFSPANLIPGIEPSPDKMLQGRLFAYSDTHRYRLGVNYQNLTVNRPLCPMNTVTQRDGHFCFDDNYGGEPNYIPNSFSKFSFKVDFKEAKYDLSVLDLAIDRYSSEEEDNFSQVTQFWEYVLEESERLRIAKNVANTLKNVKESIRNRVIANLEKVHKDYANFVKEALKKL